MTLPNGAAGINPAIQFAVTGAGELATLVSRNQDAVTAILQAQVQASTAWNGATEAVWGALRRGIPGNPVSLTLAIIEALVQRLFNIVDTFPGVHDALEAIVEVPGVRALSLAITQGTETTLEDAATYLDARWGDLLHVVDSFVDFIAKFPGATSITDVADDILPIITAISELLDGVLGTGHTMTDFVAYMEAIPGSTISGATAVEQAILDAIANALGHSGSGHTPTDILGYLEAFPASIITGALDATGVTVSGNPIGDLLSKLSSAGLYDASVGFANLSTSLLKNLTPTGGNLGQFDAAHIAGALNNAVTLQGQAVSALFNGSGHFIGVLDSAATGALNTALTVSGTAIGTLATNWNGAISDLAALQSGIVSTLGGVGADLAAVQASLAAVPPENIIGKFTATVAADLNGIGGALAAFFGLGGGGGTPTMTQIQTAAAPTALQLDSASNIANNVEAYLSTQVVSNPPNVAMADGSFPSFNHELLAGASLPTINVTQTATVGATIVLPATGTQGVPIASVAWLGGTLSGIVGVYFHIYQWNTANALAYPSNTNNLPFPTQTADIPVLLFSSPNQVATTDTVLGYSFYDFPAAGSSPPPAATAAMTPAVFTAPLGTKYLVEMQIFGSTYAVAGIQHQAPARNNAVPKYMGFTRTPGNLYGAKGVGDSSGTKNPSWNHTFATGDNCVVADVAVFSSNSAVTAVSATCGGTAMTLLKLTPNYISGGSFFGYIATFGLINPSVTTGTKSIAITVTGGGTSGTQCRTEGNSVSYPNIASFGTAANTSGSSTTAAQTISSGVAENIIHQAFAANVTGSFSAYNQSSIHTVTGGSGLVAMLIGNQIGYAASLTFTATQPSGEYCSVAVPLVPIATAHPLAPATIPTLNAAGGASPAYSTNVPFLELCGSAGVSQHAPVVLLAQTVAGTYTVTIPSVANGGWMVVGDYIDVVPCGAGASGSHAGTSGTTKDVSYKGGGAGGWNPKRLRYGDGYDIPTATTSLTINVGAGGGAITNPGLNQPPVHGNNGAATTVTGTGVTTITANGGTKDGTTLTQTTSGVFTRGDTPGNVTHEGVTYFGGAATASGSQIDGNSPGGGGSTALNDSFGQYNSGAGAPGACFITAIQQ